MQRAGRMQLPSSEGTSTRAQLPPRLRRAQRLLVLTEAADTCIGEKNLLFQQQKQGCCLVFRRVYLFQMQTNRWARRKPPAHLARPKALGFERLQLQDILLCGSRSQGSPNFNMEESTMPAWFSRQSQHPTTTRPSRARDTA